MQVRAVSTQPKCKLCASPERAEIDALCLQRSQRRIGPDEWKAAVLALGVENPTVENYKVHWKKHCEVISEEAAAAAQKAATAVVDQFTGGQPGKLLNADEAVDLVIAQGAAELEARIQADGKAGITVDQMLKAVEVKHRTRQSEAATELMKQLGEGVGAAFKQLGAGKKELPAGEVVDAEAVEVG